MCFAEERNKALQSVSGGHKSRSSRILSLFGCHFLFFLLSFKLVPAKPNNAFVVYDINRLFAVPYFKARPAF